MCAFVSTQSVTSESATTVVAAPVRVHHSRRELLRRARELHVAS